ncbi:pilus assembly protein [Aquabacterium sp.]|uniref:pilus assembly protein n=1 Tax=Aquabacterium sp. TaxID=1872578 RepID=UPI002E31C8E5|nr:PilC/PilY family type IV pilus protein [Aquabacterium sp.]HEX5311426.1 PilC/PilY family type IV pilus protein [Aquabacterium sp.]
MNSMSFPTSALARAAWVACAIVATTAALPVGAGVTDLASQPLATTPSVQAKPNLLFILDNSGSMDSDYMPDDMSSTGTYGYRSAQCNGVAYDPNMTYNPPLRADGSSYDNASFTAAYSDGYDTTSTKSSLDGKYYFVYKGSQPKMGWVYTTSGLVNNTFAQECFSAVGNNPGASVFQKVTVTLSSSATEKQNYANWYSYYRKRYLLMRTAMGRAIASLDSSYRVGFSTISDTSATEGTNYFRDVKDFDSTQKGSFYSSLYTVKPSSWTPLRAALSKAGRYYAKKAPSQTYDPMQYACQRNYALLSTDGYWNTNDESSTYGPFVVDSNTNVGNQDGTETRPMRDGSQTVVTTVTPYTAPATRDQKSNTQTRTRTWTRYVYTYGSQNSGGCTSGSKRYPEYRQTQQYTQSQTQWFLTPQQTTYTYNNTQITTEGVLTSNTNSTPAAGTWVTKTGATVQVTSTDTGDASGTTTFGNVGSPVKTQCVASPSPSTSDPTAGSWGSWSPSLTYTYLNQSIGSYTAGTPSVTTALTGGASNSLADVAEYYWKTDLRNSAFGNCTSTTSGTSRDVCEDIVRPVANDASKKQHMNTFTIGLGVSGTLTYDKNYPTQTVGDFVSLTNGTKNWPNPANGGEAINIDDLWHAGVNGRGRYYSALSATELSDAISGVVSDIASIPGAAAAAATSTLELVSGENSQVFSASYTTKFWSGDLKSYQIDGQAKISADYTWSAQAKLEAQVKTDYTARKIYFKGTSGLTLFNYDNLNTTQQGYFNNLCSKAVVASQCATLGNTDKALANNGSYLVNYLRGDRTYEKAATGTTAALFRTRDFVLGDIINGAPVFVGKPPFNYTDDGYEDFKAAKKNRQPMVYVAANDGMLHAFVATGDNGGTEAWAYIPTAVMSNLYKLADSSYGTKHQYYVDGAPIIGDVKINGAWRTILVGGLNKGGSAYYALDITDPASPSLLWEFTDANLGLSYGNPIITKRKDGTWVVAVTSGLNNTSGDGKGHLYVLDAATGTVLKDLVTTAGSPSDPSGLNKINAWIDSPQDNTAKLFYGGDMQGNVWRFNVDGFFDTASATMPAVLKLAKLQIDASHPQPITTKPMPAYISKSAVIVVGTGRYLGETDITDTTTQSLYAIRDPQDPALTTGWGDVRADTSNFVQQVFKLNNADAALSTSATLTTKKVDWTKGGWWLDWAHPRERVAINMGLQVGTLAVGTAIPTGDACASGGSSWRYYLNVTTGGALPGADAGARWSTNTLIVGISWVKDADGNVRTIFQDSDGTLRTEVPPTGGLEGGNGAHRTSWRELVE